MKSVRGTFMQTFRRSMIIVRMITDIAPRLTDVGTRTQCSRPSRRRDLYTVPWDQRRFTDHRRRVQSAGPRIDNKPPQSTVYTHVK